MPAIALKAHFDGQRILLVEDYDLPANTPLLVTVLPVEKEDDRALWLAASARGLARAYGDDEPEYTLLRGLRGILAAYLLQDGDVFP
jgi:hypothetical protein